jgi:hypothetical protein
MADPLQTAVVAPTEQTDSSLAAPPNPEHPPPQGDIESQLKGFFGQVEQPRPPQQPAIQPGPTIPPVPPPAPGAYSPEQEQEALRLANMEPDPEKRIKLIGFLKRDYANIAMMDGVTQKAREENLKKAVSQYTTAVKQIQDDPQASWQQKQVVAKKLLETMWKDPRTDYGETREQLEAHMLGLAGIQNTRGLGPLYTEAFSAIANKQITDTRQILQMEAQGKLTYTGGEHLIQALNQMGKPDHEVIIHQQALAQQAIKQEVLKDTDENIIGMKPSEKQYKRLFDVLTAFNSQIAAAGTDTDKIMKIASPDAVRELVERVYPRYERNVDYMSRGAPLNLGGITIPATVPQDEKVQTAYRDIVALPPTIPDKDGKSKQVPAANWQQAIEILRETGNVAAFQKHFPGQDGAYILKVLPYVKPPPGSNPPVVQPAEATGGFWSTLGARLFPPQTQALESDKTPISDAINRGLNVISPVPQEAKK